MLNKRTFKKETEDNLVTHGAMLIKDRTDLKNFDSGEFFIGAKAIALLVCLSSVIDENERALAAKTDDYSAGVRDTYNGIRHAIQQVWKQSDSNVATFYVDALRRVEEMSANSEFGGV